MRRPGRRLLSRLAWQRSRGSRVGQRAPRLRTLGRRITKASAGAEKTQEARKHAETAEEKLRGDGFFADDVVGVGSDLSVSGARVSVVVTETRTLRRDASGMRRMRLR